MNFVNLTPHAINIIDSEERETLVQPSGIVARRQEKRQVVRHIGTIPVEQGRYGEVVDLPGPEIDTVYIVSMRAAQGVTDREDVVFPGKAIRDEDGRFVGCRGLSTFAAPNKTVATVTVDKKLLTTVLNRAAEDCYGSTWSATDYETSISQIEELMLQAERR